MGLRMKLHFTTYDTTISFLRFLQSLYTYLWQTHSLDDRKGIKSNYEWLNYTDSTISFT